MEQTARLDMKLSKLNVCYRNKKPTFCHNTKTFDFFIKIYKQKSRVQAISAIAQLNQSHVGIGCNVAIDRIN
jgi:hypothetical protein